MKKSLFVLSALTATLLLTGCNPGKMVAPDIELAENSAVEEKMNKYTDALENLNEIMDVYREPGIALAIMPVENKTSAIGKLPNDVTIMVKSAINEIGSKVRVYQYSDQVLSSIDKLYIIEGAITEFDTTNTSKKGANAGVHGGGGRGEYDGDASSDVDDAISNMTVDFNLIEASTGAYVPKVHTSNSIKIIKKSASNDFGFSILGSGFGLSASANKEQGIHSAIRLLVDLSMVELIGKFREYPYWVAVSGGKVNQRLLRRMKKNFGGYPTEAKAIFITHLLSVIDPSIKGQEKNINAKTEKAITNYKTKYGLMPIDGALTSDLYIHLLENAPKLKGQMQLEDALSDKYNKML
ncbi:MAG: hypothetical protein KU29_09885 [Sulfurovum sp. FS06-10]|jgi:hypothetical protein|nr:MAG: hypothetical protein KU29_09885 [Sulfurovum sp. FS06-10]